ncbi:hypothetical protein [Mycolicibacterium brisbanense]|uniref:Uncharacterized protein n=1 Tax=Mycolicibacterium brisbanense TaxID=146020 RepID=A0A100VXQ5_9MYCO|nr:hypothetical protein [Mycolicibacterium brisbanense]MCV7157318.1 hypothetical protein [Mycolicibacterium brisbanense]GAS87946.1 uncharacterized protein RMCB_2042 [Mycolicibacterium brisbanense]
MIGARVGVPLLALLLLTGCASVVSGTPTWPGATLEKVLLTAADFPAGVQYDRIVEKPGQPDGTGAPPSMLSNPEGCSDGLTRVIARSAERGPGSAGKYVLSYDGARMVITVLTSPLPLDQLDATAQRCAQFRTFFDPGDAGIPITTTKLEAQRPAELVYQQTMQLSGSDSSAYFAFENIGSWSVFGVTFPTQNPSIPVKATLPQTFLDAFDQQVHRIQAR